MATSLRYQKRGPDRSSTSKTLSFREKIAKIGPADLDIICLREIIKKDFETGNVWQSLAYSPLGAC